MGTNKEQHITITGRSGLDDSEKSKLKRDLEDHHLHLPSIQLLHQSRTTIPTLGRLMLGATASTKVIFNNKCEPYKEKTCWTQNEEICSPVMYKNCTGVIETNIERVCFNVN